MIEGMSGSESLRSVDGDARIIIRSRPTDGLVFSMVGNRSIGLGRGQSLP